MFEWHAAAQALWWSFATIALYQLSKRLHRQVNKPWASPLLLAPVGLIALALLFHVTYRQYITGTHWLVTLFAPATVAFAVPIYDQRALIRRYWPVLVAGAFIGSVTAVLSSWALAHWLGLNDSLRLSLMPRSISTPFALIVSDKIGGIPPLTAVFVLITGIGGSVLGELMLDWLPLRTALSRGALFGMGAHGFGAAKANQIDGDIGSIAGLVMVFSGLLNVLASPLLGYGLR